MQRSRLKRQAVAGALNVSQQQLARAKGYPYARPDSSFLYAGTNVYLFRNKSWVSPSKIADLRLDYGSSGADVLKANGISTEVLTEQWTPVLAIGSNAGPEQLARKFPVDMFPKGVLIPVVECVLEDFDVVYSPFVTSYGSCPATLEHSPGTAAGVFMTYLTPELAARMHATEGAYNLCELRNVRLHVGLSLSEFSEGATAQYVQPAVYQYNHQLGSLHLPLRQPQGASTPVSLAEIPAIQRRFPALTQEDVQQALRWALEHGEHGALAPVDLPLTVFDPVAIPVTTDAIDSSVHAVFTQTVCTQNVPAGFPTQNGNSQIYGSNQAPEWRGVEGLDNWILSNVRSNTVREQRLVRLHKWGARPFMYKDVRVVMELGSMWSKSVL